MPQTHSNHRGYTAQRFFLLRDVTRGDGTSETLTVNTGATQPSGLNCFGTLQEVMGCPTPSQ
jgi:hypothetical protein